MSEEGIPKGYVVTCPRCGHIQQRGFESDATLICGNCHYEFYVFMERGFQMKFPGYWVENEAMVNRMKAFVVSIGCGHGRITYQPIAEQNHSMEDPTSYGTRFFKADQDLVRKIKRITNRGNDAEIRCGRDGGLKVYEIRKNITKD